MLFFFQKIFIPIPSLFFQKDISCAFENNEKSDILDPFENTTEQHIFFNAFEILYRFIIFKSIQWNNKIFFDVFENNRIIQISSEGTNKIAKALSKKPRFFINFEEINENNDIFLTDYTKIIILLISFRERKQDNLKLLLVTNILKLS